MNPPASLLSALFVLLLIACGSQSPAPKAPPPTSAGAEAAELGLSIPIETFTLENGLRVILHQDKSDPIVAMATVVHVGSSREEPGRTGFAHFFEHMSFNNSENVPMGANRKMIPELGGRRNGGTWSDGTIYYEVVPVDAFEKLLWIDSDRFGYMINTVKEGTLEREKQVVKNEKRQRVDNRPYGHTEHVIRKALYPAGHPYNWTVIGELEDLQRATLDDVREFYRRYYTPANATLVVAGDIEIPEAKALVQKWFGEIPAGESVRDLEPMPVELAEEKRLFHLDNFAKVAELRLTFPTVEQYHPDSYALEALGYVLSEGKSAPLYRTIVEEAEQSSRLYASQDSSELAGTFGITVRANPGVDLDAVRASVAEALARFEKEGLRKTDLQRFKAEKETGYYAGMESVLNRALELGIYQEFAGDPEYLATEIEEVRALSEKDVMRAYHKYIKGRPSVVTSFVPKAQPELIVDGSQRAAVTEEKIVAGAEKEFVEDDGDDFERTPTELDRSEPPLGPAPEVKAPEVWRATSRAGIQVLGVEHDELPMVSFDLRIDGGQWLDSADKLGAARLTAELLNEGTKHKTPLELEDAIGLLGARVRVHGTRSALHVSGQTLAKNFQSTMELVSEMLLAPRWDAGEFERLKTARLAAIAERDGDPTAIARLAFRRQLYGPDHPAGQPFGGSAKSVSALELGDLRNWYEEHVSPKSATLHVAGAVPQDSVLRSLETLDARWQGEKVELPPLTPPSRPDKARLFFIDVPGAKQSVIYVGTPAVKGDDPRYYSLSVANDRLGSGSSARLTQTLRIEKGYSYGAYSSFTRVPYTGAFIASTSVRSNVTLESLQIFKDLIGSYEKTFGEKELLTTKSRLSKTRTRQFETRAQLVELLTTMSAFGLEDDYIEQENRQLQSLTVPDMRTLIAEHLGAERMLYVVVGDGKTQLTRLKKLGYGEPVLLDRSGEPLP